MVDFDFLESQSPPDEWHVPSSYPDLWDEKEELEAADHKIPCCASKDELEILRSTLFNIWRPSSASGNAKRCRGDDLSHLMEALGVRQHSRLGR